jgi:SAM-dependent methyltransferase
MRPSSLHGGEGVFVMTAAVAPIYGAYAPIYDLIGQGRFGARLAEATLRRLRECGTPARRVLDLACGGGAAALVFAAAGARVVGVDRSAAMLGIARGRARDAKLDVTFVQADISELKIENEELRNSHSATDHSQFSILNSQFDLAVCFGGLNYATADGDLGRIFGVAAALRPGGGLVFDLTAEAEYATWDERDIVTYDGRDCLVYNQLSYDEAARLATRRIVWLVRETELWWRGEETHVERAWGDGEVRAALESAGLELETLLTPEEAAPQVVYIARKRGV